MPAALINREAKQRGLQFLAQNAGEHYVAHQLCHRHFHGNWQAVTLSSLCSLFGIADEHAAWAAALPDTRSGIPYLRSIANRSGINPTRYLNLIGIAAD
jgi:hypothetical protein